MFAVGDKVVHSEFGICRVTNIGIYHLPGQQPENYYILTPFMDDGHGTTYYVAVSRSECLREPLRPDQICSMIDAMPDVSPLKLESAGNRAQDMENAKAAYRDLMNSGEIQDWVVLLKTIYTKGKQLSVQHKKISEFESLARETGERLLYGEIAGVMDIPVSQVEQFIAKRLRDKK